MKINRYTFLVELESLEEEIQAFTEMISDNVEDECLLRQVRLKADRFRSAFAMLEDHFKCVPGVFPEKGEK